MPYTVRQFEATPNPNAMKCTLDRSLPPPSRSYRSRAEAPDHATDPVGAALFEVPGVVGVLLNGGWLTVSKEPSADWASVQRGVRSALGGSP